MQWIVWEAVRGLFDEDSKDIKSVQGQKTLQIWRTFGMATKPETTNSQKPSGVFLPSTEDLKTLSGTDPVLAYMIAENIPLTRENYIAVNWLGDPPDPWTGEDEDELPEFLQDTSR
jgi:hypothetical protein